jgi:hypothetical protein
VNNDLNNEQDQPPKRGGKFKFLIIALAPLPVGAFLFASKMARMGNSPGVLLLVGLVSLVCCVYATIGMLGGYDAGKPRPAAWITGIILGIALFVVLAFIVLFIGCAVSFKGM